MAERYRTIVADPPWPYEQGFGERVNRPHKQDRKRGAVGLEITRRDLPYASMSLYEIMALPISDLAATDCRLFFWTTNRYLPDAFDALRAWRFTYRQLIVWDKTPNFNPLSGSIAPNAAEYLLVATRGKPERRARVPSSVMRARKARSRHSGKPDIFLDIAEQVSPGPYLELFARRARFGWDYWGDESLQTVDLAS